MALPKHRPHVEVRGQPPRSSRQRLVTISPTPVRDRGATCAGPEGVTHLPNLGSPAGNGATRSHPFCGRDGVKRACALLVLMEWLPPGPLLLAGPVPTYTGPSFSSPTWAFPRRRPTQKAHTHPPRPSWGLCLECLYPNPTSSAPMWDATCGPQIPLDHCLSKTLIF